MPLRGTSSPSRSWQSSWMNRAPIHPLQQSPLTTVSAPKFARKPLQRRHGLAAQLIITSFRTGRNRQRKRQHFFRRIGSKAVPYAERLNETASCRQFVCHERQAFRSCSATTIAPRHGALQLICCCRLGARPSRKHLAHSECSVESARNADIARMGDSLHRCASDLIDRAAVTPSITGISISRRMMS